MGLNVYKEVWGLYKPALALVALAGALSACSGGGGGGGASALPATTVPQATSTTNPVPQTTNTPLPSSGAASTLSNGATTTVSGTVQDLSSSAAIASATVIVGPTLITGSTPPPSVPSGDVSTTTNGSGTFSVLATYTATSTIQQLTGGGAVPSNPQYIMIFPADTTHLAIHGIIGYSAGTTAAGTLKSSTLSTDEQAIYTNETTLRAGQGLAAVVLDEYVEEAARVWATQMGGNGIYDHCNPEATTNPPTTGFVCKGSLNVYLAGTYTPATPQGFVWGENIDAQSSPSTIQSADNAYVSEGSSGGHFQRLFSTKNVWTGVAVARNGKTIQTSPLNPGTFSGNYDYYVEDYIVSFP